jgi:hypothetical protein
MRRRLALLLLGLAVPVGVLIAATELVLQDGRVITGVEVGRDGDNYVLVLESGDSIVIPAVLVKTVRLTGPFGPHDPLTPAQPEDLGAPPPPGPSGIVRSEARTLAGTTVRAPTTAEQLAALGPPAKFQQDVVDNGWEPASDWDPDPVRQNNFAPSTWSKGVIDSNWQPKSAFDPSKDVLEDSRSTFQQGVIDSSWTPTDGFAR